MKFLFCLFAILGTSLAERHYNYTIANFLQHDHYTRTMRQEIEKAGLLDILNGTGPYTVFAPTDAAFGRTTKLPNDTTALQDVLKYHMVSGEFKHADIMINEKLLTTLSQQKLRLNNYHHVRHVTVDGSIVSGDYILNNGAVHIINDVLYPPDGSVLDILSNDNKYSILLQKIMDAGVADLLNDGPITMFAPTNAAFQAADNATLSYLDAHTDVLAVVLKYHVVPGTLYTTGMHTEYLHTMDEADRIHLHKKFFGGWSVDHGSMPDADIDCTNGVLHAVDSVLIPASVAKQIP